MGEHLYAGGRQIGGAIEVETLKPVSQSYLTSLWNQQAFRKEKGELLDSLTNRYSRRFSRIVISIAVGAALFWAWFDPARSLVSFTAVLIVACPCALALAAPFTLGTAQRVLARRKVFLKNSSVIETLARVNAVVFDKTGTLTAANAGSVTFYGKPLTPENKRWIYSVAKHSTHPSAVRVAEATGGAEYLFAVSSFLEKTGLGIKGFVAGHEIVMGSAVWLTSNRVRITAPAPETGSIVHLAIDGVYRGCYALTHSLRPETDALIRKLGENYELALLSGDNEKERDRFSALFGASHPLHFNQSPLNKLGFIRELQSPGKLVMMVGDGLNDAGALQQSDVGVAVVEDIGAFSPASDVIMAANMVPRLHEVLRFSQGSVRVVQLSFFISSLYNVVGISLAARGLLSPIICAVLMPVSSVTVMAFACGLTNWLGRRILGPTPIADSNEKEIPT